MSHRHRTPSERTHVLPLEPRRLFCVDILHADDAGHALGTYPAAAGTEVAAAADVVEPVAAAVEVAGLNPLGAVPALHGRPAAEAKLYLDFDGDVTGSWGSSTPGVTPAFDTDSDPLTFNDGEIAAIREIHARVVEKFSPFDLNVTTVDPGAFADRVAGRVVIGGNGTWFGGAGGVAFVGGFYNGSSNTCFVFSRNLSGGSPKAVAEAIAHEAGHTFGLEHQSLWSGTTLTQEYNGGTAASAPVMGSSYGATRGLWWRGTPSSSATGTQDDLAILSGTDASFGYRPDDHSAINAGATALGLAAGTQTVLGARTGVIERPSDTDFFSFTTPPGRVSLLVRPAGFGPMLDVKVELRDPVGGLVATASTASLAETLTATVPGGTFFVHVKGSGQYGDVGQYTVSGNVAAPVIPTAPAAPTDLVATVVSRAAVRLQWADASNDETGFNVFRSTDGATWSRLAALGAGATSYTATWLRSQARYQFKVTSFNGAGESASAPLASVLAGAWQVPAVAVAPAASATQSATAAGLGSSEVPAWADAASRMRRLIDVVAGRAGAA